MAQRDQLEEPTRRRAFISRLVLIVVLGVLALGALSIIWLHASPVVARIALVAVVAGTVWGSGRRRQRNLGARAEAASRARFEAIVEHSSDLIVLTDGNGRATYVSPSLPSVLGYSNGGRSSRGGLMNLVHPDDMGALVSTFDEARSSGRAGPSDFRIRSLDGSWRVMELNITDLRALPEVGGILWNSRDVTERRRLEQELVKAAFEDALTHLPNRALLLDRLELARAKVTRGHAPLAVLLTDLDGFKEVNDSLGRDAGDAVLIEVAARLAECVRQGDTIARMEGDEFVILVEDLDDPAFAVDLARRLLESMHEPIFVAGSELRLGLSAGVAYSQHGEETAQELLRSADVAMYTAKSQGGGKWVAFDPSMQQRAQTRLQLSADLDHCIERQELETYYQPIHSLETSEIEGTEALVRWHHPARGFLLPGAFISIAEHHGQIRRIGRWVLEQACRQGRAWQLEFPHLPPRFMSVNLSGAQLNDDDLAADVRTILDDTEFDPASLVLEITESVLMGDIDAGRRKLTALRDLGVRLAIDDFGTGYSSLAYLRDLPVDILKVDGSFVEAAVSTTDGGTVIRGIVNMAASLQLTTIVEGIETPEQLAHLRALGCRLGQGFLLTRPMPAAGLTERLLDDDAEHAHTHGLDTLPALAV